jgi:hypothetical protein
MRLAAGSPSSQATMTGTLPLTGTFFLTWPPVVTERLWTREARFFKKHLGAPVRR